MNNEFMNKVVEQLKSDNQMDLELGNFNQPDAYAPEDDAFANYMEWICTVSEASRIPMSELSEYVGRLLFSEYAKQSQNEMEMLGGVVPFLRSLEASDGMKNELFKNQLDFNLVQISQDERAPCFKLTSPFPISTLLGGVIEECINFYDSSFALDRHDLDEGGTSSLYFIESGGFSRQQVH